MKAKAKCPNCNEIVFDDCLGCVSGGTLMHSCKDGEPEIYDVDWKIIDCTKREAEELVKLGFKGKIPEVLE